MASLKSAYDVLNKSDMAIRVFFFLLFKRQISFRLYPYLMIEVSEENESLKQGINERNDI